MLNCLAAVLILAPYPAPQELPGYRPTFVPAALADAPSTSVRVPEASIRGHRIIESWRVVERDLPTLVHALASETTPQEPIVLTEPGMLERAQAVALDRVLPDRVVSLMVYPGRAKSGTPADPSARPFVDADRYSTVLITERSRYAGTLPKDWPIRGDAISVPRSFRAPTLPIVESRPPDYVGRDQGRDGVTTYRLEWYVKDTGEAFFRKQAEAVERLQTWSVSEIVTDGFSCRPRDSRSPYRSLQVHRVAHVPEMPEGWTLVQVRWVDPATVRAERQDLERRMQRQATKALRNADESACGMNHAPRVWHRQ